MRFLAFVAAVIIALLIVSYSDASTSTTLNRVASNLSGHTVTVQGYMDDKAWVSLLNSQTNLGGDTSAFTIPGQPVIYLGPRVYTEVVGLADGENMGAFLGSEGLLTLAHEAAHQAGVLNEGAADCLALSEVKQEAIAFGIPAKIRRTFIKHRRVKINGKRMRIPVLAHKTIPNPFLKLLQKDARRWHESRGPAYRGSCG